ncbi:MAG TPA: NAD(P)-dependent oxidoreductase, partial [Balneolaceae bacterium]|nr:NAD(P)-dependent oxidoreductase [Balneolaceae bacterium]
MTRQILVTTKANPDQRHLIENLLSANKTNIDFLYEVSKERRQSVLKNAEILLTLNPLNDLDNNEFDLLENVDFIQLISAGADHFPYHKFPEDIIIASNPGAYAEPIAEHVVAMVLALAKRLQEEHQKMQQGEFNQFHFNKSIKDSTIGILGFGGIGKATAKLFGAFGSRIFAMNTSGKTDESVDFIGTTKDLKHILKSSDVVVLSLPLNNNTRGLIEKEQLEWMKDDAILINVARGEIINQKDLYEHLKNNSGFKAGLESWWVEPLRHGSFKLEYPLLDLPNVLASPHNSSM